MTAALIVTASVAVGFFLLMAVLVQFPHATPAALCAAAAVGTGALIYVCGDERGFLSDSYVGKVMADYDRAKALKDPRPNWAPWEDG